MCVPQRRAHHQLLQIAGVSAANVSKVHTTTQWRTHLSKYTTHLWNYCSSGQGGREAVSTCWEAVRKGRRRASLGTDLQKEEWAIGEEEVIRCQGKVSEGVRKAADRTRRRSHSQGHMLRRGSGNRAAQPWRVNWSADCFNREQPQRAVQRQVLA